jgi:hypothetical protein
LLQIKPPDLATKIPLPAKPTILPGQISEIT